jgi:hypothetical protein
MRPTSPVGYIFIAYCIMKLSLFLILLPSLHCEGRMVRWCCLKKTSNVDKEYTNPSHQVVRATRLYTFAPYICGPSVWHLIHVTFLAHRILIWLLGFWKNCGFMVYVTLYATVLTLGNRYRSLICALFCLLLTSFFVFVLASCFRSV